jgi:hypothetical protein
VVESAQLCFHKAISLLVAVAKSVFQHECTPATRPLKLSAINRFHSSLIQSPTGAHSVHAHGTLQSVHSDVHLPMTGNTIGVAA